MVVEATLLIPYSYWCDLSSPEGSGMPFTASGAGHYIRSKGVN